jgi:hypothetical protein
MTQSVGVGRDVVAPAAARGTHGARDQLAWCHDKVDE